jgi:hypothetical protein
MDREKEEGLKKEKRERQMNGNVDGRYRDTDTRHSDVIGNIVPKRIRNLPLPVTASAFDSIR